MLLEIESNIICFHLYYYIVKFHEYTTLFFMLQGHQYQSVLISFYQLNIYCLYPLGISMDGINLIEKYVNKVKSPSLYFTHIKIIYIIFVYWVFQSIWYICPNGISPHRFFLLVSSIFLFIHLFFQGNFRGFVSLIE